MKKRILTQWNFGWFFPSDKSDWLLAIYDITGVYSWRFRLECKIIDFNQFDMVENLSDYAYTLNGQNLTPVASVDPVKLLAQLNTGGRTYRIQIVYPAVIDENNRPYIEFQYIANPLQPPLSPTAMTIVITNTLTNEIVLDIVADLISDNAAVQILDKGSRQLNTNTLDGVYFKSERDY